MLRLGVVIYWASNAALLVAEARWHILYHLTVWDIWAIRTHLPALAKLVHPS
jgi:hypothetical protein